MLRWLLPRNKNSLLWFIALPLLAGISLFAKRSHTHSADGIDEDVYLIGKKGNPKMVFVTNRTPKNAMKTAAKKYADSNFR